MTPRSVQNAKRAGVAVDFDNFESYVHVSPALMDKLDNVYLEHFRGDGEVALRLLDCFRIYEEEQHEGLFVAYLDDVKTLLLSETEGADAQNDPQAYGARMASLRLMEALLPLDGRLCLPLATSSMLEDLKTCVIRDEMVVPQVRGFSHR